MAATLEELATNVSVSEFLESGAEARGHGRPAHHLNDHQTKFANPWPSYRYVIYLSMCVSGYSAKSSSDIPFLPFKVRLPFSQI